MTVKRYSSVEFDELQKGGLLLKGNKRDREEQDSKITLDFKTLAVKTETSDTAHAYRRMQRSSQNLLITTTIFIRISTFTDEQYPRPLKNRQSLRELLKDARNEAGECHNDMRILLHSK
jgi:hypothetical protein